MSTTQKPTLADLAGLVTANHYREWSTSENRFHYEQELLESFGFEYNKFNRINLLGMLIRKSNGK